MALAGTGSRCWGCQSSSRGGITPMGCQEQREKGCLGCPPLPSPACGEEELVSVWICLQESLILSLINHYQLGSLAVFSARMDFGGSPVTGPAPF